MNKDRDRRIARALKIPWHESEGVYSSAAGKGKWRCKTCDTDWFGWDGVELPICKFNPSFDSPSGLVTILNEGPKQEWWGSFMSHLWRCEKPLGYADQWDNCHVHKHINLEFLQSPPRLAEVLDEFIQNV